MYKLYKVVGVTVGVKVEVGVGVCVCVGVFDGKDTQPKEYTDVTPAGDEQLWRRKLGVLQEHT
jgi:argonaute-like protein implicated in RNA metabolism and viral defense